MNVRTLLMMVPACLMLCVPEALAQKPYRGAEYRTLGTMTYGRFEVRMRSAAVSGMLASFFTYHDPASPWNEIDIENMGRYTNEVQFNTIVPTVADNHVERQAVQFNPHTGFHVYGIEWTPAYVAWQIDGEEVCRQFGAHITQIDRPQKLMMNIWQPAAADWAGTFSSASLPVYAYYDWVRYSAYTPGTGDNFTLQWTDDFTTFDTQRWQKATHTWDGNNAQFVTANAVLTGGYLILCLTSNTTSGFPGGTIPDTDADPPYPVSARAYDSTIVVRFSEPVTEASVTAPGNFFGGPVQYAGATLRPDNRTVDVAARGMDLATPFIMFAHSIQDRATPANTLSLKPIRVLMPLSFPIRIDVGGSGDSDFLPDSVWTVSKQYGRTGGVPYAVAPATAIANTTRPAVFRTGVHGIAGYTIRVPNGHYTVTLMFAEDKHTASGKRIFSARAEGKEIVRDCDLVRQAGALTAYEPLVADVQVSDNLLDIWFGASVDSTTLAGITVERASEPTGVNQHDVPVPQPTFSIYPNPFNASATLAFSQVTAGPATIKVQDLLGRLVDTLDLGVLTPGEHTVRWKGDQMASGTYFCTLDASGRQLTRRILLMR
ncbi:MAG TPA: family 16 glycosylhydrolase [Bacteroidota bacterium]|nr:family 16 glycosylhydrolase [Bacteroidota bacterium]